MCRQRFLYFTKPSAPKVHQISPFFPFSPHGLRILFPFRGTRGPRRASGAGRTGSPGRAGGAGGAGRALPAAVPSGGEVAGLPGGPLRPVHLHPVEAPLPTDHLAGAVGLPTDKGNGAAAPLAGPPGMGLPGLAVALRVSALVSFHIASFLRLRRLVVRGTSPSPHNMPGSAVWSQGLFWKNSVAYRRKRWYTTG